MSRRAFAFILVALATCHGLFGFASVVEAQQPASPRRIGVLLVGPTPDSKEAQAFRQGLRDAGYAEGRDVVIEWRSAAGDYARVPALAADLVQSKVDVIVADSTVAAQAAKRATSTIPIVMTLVSDPVGSGLVANLAHPGGNIAGLTILTTELSAKMLQLLKDVMPRLTRVAVLGNPDGAYHPKAVEDLKAVAPSPAIELSFVGVRTPEGFGPAFSDVSRAHAQALYVSDDALFFNHRTTLLKLASKARLPAIYSWRRWVDEGGLISYGANFGIRSADRPGTSTKS